jgi:hypothetical protein
MQFSALGVGGAKRAAAKGEKPQTIVMRLTDIKLEPNKPGYFHGVNADTGEAIAVRLMTVDEGAAVNKRQDESYEQAKDRLNKQYVGSGQSHRPRPSEINNPSEKVHCAPGGLIMFTKALPNEDGTFRAHWAETLESKPGAVCEKVLASVHIGEITDREDRSKVTGSYVYADVIKPEHAAVLTKDNAELVLQAAFTNRDGDVQRSPFVLARVVSAEDGKVLTSLPELKVNAALVEETIDDPDSGTSKKVKRPGDAAQTLAWINDPTNTARDSMILRAALHGALGKDGYADFGEAPDNAKAELNQITDAIRSGSYHFEVIPGERISAGPATKSSLLKAWKEKENHPLNFYKGRAWLEDASGEKRERNVRNYFDTYLTKKVGDGGYPYFTKAVAAEAFPKKANLYTVATANDFKTPVAEAKARAAQADAGVVASDEDEFDPNALTGSVDTKGVDAQLTASAASLEMS